MHLTTHNAQHTLDLPERQIVFASQIVVRLDPILQRLHGVVRKAHGSFIFLAELRGLVHRSRRGRRRSCHVAVLKLCSFNVGQLGSLLCYAGLTLTGEGAIISILSTGRMERDLASSAGRYFVEFETVMQVDDET